MKPQVSHVILGCFSAERWFLTFSMNILKRGVEGLATDFYTHTTAAILCGHNLAACPAAQTRVAVEGRLGILHEAD